jgi:hypothetical protein
MPIGAVLGPSILSTSSIFAGSSVVLVGLIQSTNCIGRKLDSIGFRRGTTWLLLTEAPTKDFLSSA